MIKDIEPNLIYLVLDGSRAHGTFTEESDYDYRGIFANTKEEIYGYDIKETIDFKNDDIVLHGLKKFMSLALNSNPNVLELLFMDNTLIEVHPLFKEYFLVNRDKLITIRSGKAYGGFAKSQVERNRNRAGHGSIRDKYKFGPEDDLYDSKYAMHTVRMLMNGIEMITRGTLHPRFEGDSLTLLKNIRTGKTFKNGTEFYEYAHALDELLQIEIVEASKHKRLPENGDKDFFGKQLVEFYDEYFYDNILTMEK